MSTILEEITDQPTWHKYLFGLSDRPPGPHFLQSWPWGELKANHGWEAHRYIVRRDEEVIGAFQLLTRLISRTPKLKLGYIPRGPVLAAQRDLKSVLSAIEHAARQHRCFYVKADPDFEQDSDLGDAWRAAASAKRWRYSPEQIQPRATGWTDLLPGDKAGEAKLLAAMTKRWRYNVKLGPKRGVSAEPVEGNDFRDFYALYRETGKRQGFGLRSIDYYQEVAERFGQGESTGAQLFVARHKDEAVPLAGAFLLQFGKRWWYFYGASSNRRRADMPTYCLQWTTQRWARDHGGETYDWWGAPEDPDNKKDSRYRVWHFKKGFGPRHVLSVGAWDKPLGTLLYRSYMLPARLRKPAARLRSKLPF